MRILVIGSGGREHAIAWKLAKSRRVSQIYVAPGNGGMQWIPPCICVPLSVTDHEGLIQFVKEKQIDLTIVGPEVSLLAGIVDRFEAEGLRIFGPRRSAARIEGSKRFAKELMQKYKIPTAAFRAFRDADEAKKYVRWQGAPIVIKADGLAAGKGVVVAQTVAEAEQAIEQMMERKVFGAAGDEIVFEEFLTGPEISLMAFVDGKTMKPMVVAQDHKRLVDGDKGPNTGGMGAYSPVPQIPAHIIDQAIETILQPMVRALQQEGIEYKGVLYAGLMVTMAGPKVIEFNARFGDPETQVVLPRMKTDLLDVLLAVVEGRLDEQEIEWDNQAAVCVVMTAGGYPGKYETGYVVSGVLVERPGEVVFHAGTERPSGEFITAGGRVVGVTALGKDVAEARDRAYARVERIFFKDRYYRTDIAARGV